MVANLWHVCNKWHTEPLHVAFSRSGRGQAGLWQIGLGTESRIGDQAVNTGWEAESTEAEEGWRGLEEV